MANKYIDVSATFNGDGTSSAQAASDGAIGSWNSLSDVWDGVPTYGILNIGDVVYIRTYNAGNLSESQITNNLTLMTGAIKYVFDAGIIWVGDSGTFTLTMGTTSTIRTIYFSSQNIVEGVNKNFILEFPFNVNGVQYSCYFNGCVLRDFIIKTGQSTGNSVSRFALSNYQNSHFENMIFDIGNKYNLAYPQFRFNSYQHHTFYNCEFVLTRLIDSNLFVLFGITGPYGLRVTFFGGKIVDPTENHNLCTFPSGSSTNTVAIFDGFNTGVININATMNEGVILDMSNIGGSWGMTRIKNRGRVDWRAGQNYPYATAILPDSANTPWSYKIFPETVSDAAPFFMPVIAKLFTGIAGIKTLSCHIAINNSYTFPQKDEWWMVINYIKDIDGVRVTEISRTPGALATTSGVWTPDPPIYGAQNYTAYKLELTTAFAIKQDTDISMILITNRQALLSTDYYFVNPELDIT